LLLLVLLAFRGWSVLAAFGGQPPLANWLQIFMGSAATFLAQSFPLFARLSAEGIVGGKDRNFRGL
jgi:hypothetical protein